MEGSTARCNITTTVGPGASLAARLASFDAKDLEDFDRQVEQISKESFPETAILRLVYGVGPLIALAFVATIGDPRRFKRSRSVGAYFGLVPRSSQSGNRNPTLSISKEGDRFMRSLLVSAPESRAFFWRSEEAERW